MSKNIMEAKMGMKLKNEFGTCFDSTWKELIDNKFLRPLVSKEIQIINYDDVKSLKVCHGIGIANAPGQEGRQLAHSWFEYTIDSKRGAYDVLWGAATQAAHYRKQLLLSYVVEYDLEDYVKKWVDTDYPGPWDSKIKAVADKANEQETKI